MFTANSDTYLKQMYRAEVLVEKMRSATIMQAWIDGYELVSEIHDELTFEHRK